MGRLLRARRADRRQSRAAEGLAQPRVDRGRCRTGHRSATITAKLARRIPAQLWRQEVTRRPGLVRIAPWGIGGVAYLAADTAPSANKRAGIERHLKRRH